MWVKDSRRPTCYCSPTNLAEQAKVFQKVKALKQQGRSPQEIRNELAVESLTGREASEA